MSMFLKFSFIIINLSHIKHIDIHPDKYDIHLSDNKLKGYFFLKNGYLFSKSNEIEISKITHPYDYIKMTNFIEKLN